MHLILLTFDGILWYLSETFFKFQLSMLQTYTPFVIFRFQKSKSYCHLSRIVFFLKSQCLCAPERLPQGLNNNPTTFKSYCRFYIRVMSYGWRILDSLGRKWRVGGALEHVCTVLITFSTCTFPWETCWQTYLCHHVLIHNKLVMGWDSSQMFWKFAFECN